MVRSEAGPSNEMEETDLVWPCPEDPTKVRFILRDSQECLRWDILGGEDSPWSLISPSYR